MSKKAPVDYSLFDKLLYPILVINDKYDIIFLNASAKKEYLPNLLDQKCYKISRGYDKPCNEMGEGCPIKKIFWRQINAGAVLFPDDGADFKTLYERAGTALFNVKKKRTGDIVILE